MEIGELIITVSVSLSRVDKLKISPLHEIF